MFLGFRFSSRRRTISLVNDINRFGSGSLAASSQSSIHLSFFSMLSPYCCPSVLESPSLRLCNSAFSCANFFGSLTMVTRGKKFLPGNLSRGQTTAHWLSRWLLAFHVLSLPSTGCFPLFGVDVQKRFPYACVTFTQNDKSRIVINGNLVTQFRNILDLLSADEVNPRIRLKTDRVAEEQDAYPARALTELTVNLLVHRDYAAADYSRIEFTRGRSLLFENPGGLMPTIKKGVHPDGKGKFKPVRGLTEMRNPLLADVFFGIGSMDKEGSGLADVEIWLWSSGARLSMGLEQITNHFEFLYGSPFKRLRDVPA